MFACIFLKPILLNDWVNVYSITYKDNPVIEKWYNHLGIYYLDGDPIRSTLTQTIGQILSIFWEGLSVEGDSSIIRQEIGVQENPRLWLQRVLHIGHTAVKIKLYIFPFKTLNTHNFCQNIYVSKLFIFHLSLSRNKVLILHTTCFHIITIKVAFWRYHHVKIFDIQRSSSPSFTFGIHTVCLSSIIPIIIDWLILVFYTVSAVFQP